jgi:murein L,D-transpeptidase YafK
MRTWATILAFIFASPWPFLQTSAKAAAETISPQLQNSTIENKSFEPISPMVGIPKLINGTYGFQQPNPAQGIPKAFVSLGAVESTYGIIVEKLHHRLSVFKLDQEGQYQLVKTYRAITGKDPNDKKTRGDFRTPEGIYFVSGRLKDDVLPPKYGRGALTLDYPNIFDLQRRKSGSGIWIHGTDDPKRLQNPYDTEGCVVVSNEDYMELLSYITPFEVPIVITKEMETVAQNQIHEPKAKALEMIESWKTNWQTSEFDNYMNHYSKSFRSLGMSKQNWERYKTSLSQTRAGDIRIQLSDPIIVSFEDQLLAVFLQRYESKEHSDYGRKFLYLKWEGDKYRIIAEKWYKIRESSTVQNNVLSPNNPM